MLHQHQLLSRGSLDRSSRKSHSEAIMLHLEAHRQVGT